MLGGCQEKGSTWTSRRGGGARSNEEGLTGTYAFSLQRQRGEPQGHRNLLATVGVRGFVEVSPESSGSSLNPVERNLAVV